MICSAFDMKLRSTQPIYIYMKVHGLFVLDMKLKLGGKNLLHFFGLLSYYMVFLELQNKTLLWTVKTI
jgi:hypothetical protein